MGFTYRDAGVDRVVLGLQTLDERLRGVIGRSAKAPDAVMLDSFFSVSGIVHCVDIITGIPGQDGSALARELERVLAYRPAHVSAYILTLQKDTPLSRRMSDSNELALAQRKRFEELIAVMEERGYIHYEVSNFCLPGFESRHNMKYWTFAPYFGYGPGAHSFNGTDRFYNARTVEEYIERPSTAPVLDERTEGAAAEEFLLTGLRLSRRFMRWMAPTPSAKRAKPAQPNSCSRMSIYSR